MKIAYASDLHLEFQHITLNNTENADVLVLAGDICTVKHFHSRPEMELAYHEFFKNVSEQFKHVVYIVGNHEHYHYQFVHTVNDLKLKLAEFKNIHVLDNEVFDIENYTFVGSTLWTDMNKGDPLTLHAVRDMMNDFRIIRKEHEGFTNLKPHDTVIRHKQTLDYIGSVVAEKHDEKFVVVGHHSPSFQSVHEQYRGETLMNGAYHSDLSEFILDRPQIKLWTHGHTHHCFDYMIGETRVFCNPRGYIGYETKASDWTLKSVEI